ncbi:uncharacterized protein RSE6_02095 [Rhynchosporium secalis]|uniref:Uncharacterized protein n=1 Tax=Rhynchosporium secalis TaxID=38038 RepID=A0A1E1LZF6_RHYSE|nr:uncharacterized protein RSE6_02095 [Rhynchosporium secalis]
MSYCITGLFKISKISSDKSRESKIETHHHSRPESRTPVRGLESELSVEPYRIKHSLPVAAKFGA